MTTDSDRMAPLLHLLDPVAVAQLRELDPTGASGLLPRVFKAFEGSLQRLLTQLLDGRRAQDNDAIKMAAHTLKSPAASVGALDLAKLCADIERAIRQDQVNELDPLLDGMVAESRRVLAVLKPALER